MGLVGQDRGELHTRNRGISRRVTIQWLSHKSLWMASSDVLRGAGGIVGPRCSAGGPTMTLDNGVRTVFTGCTSAAADTWPDTAIGGAEAMSRRSGSTWSLSGRESATHLLEYKAADEGRSARSDTPISRARASHCCCVRKEEVSMGLLAARSLPSETIRIIPLTPADSTLARPLLLGLLLKLSQIFLLLLPSFLLPEVLISRWAAIP